MDAGEGLTRWTVRLAVALYVLGLLLRSRRPGAARLAWTCGVLAFLAHVACAFQFYHHWSHHAAYTATARQTAETIGLDWGGGLYGNYAFTLVWLIDAGWWWLRPTAYLRRPRPVEWGVQGFLAFIVFNATVVFGSPAVRGAGIAACLLLIAGFRYTRVGAASTPAPSPSKNPASTARYSSS